MPAKYFTPTLQPYHAFLFGFLNEWKFSFAYLSNFEQLQEDMPGIKKNNFTRRVDYIRLLELNLLFPIDGIKNIDWSVLKTSSKDTIYVIRDQNHVIIFSVTAEYISKMKMVFLSRSV